jgi:uncharacterized protein with PIN domain
MISTRSGGLRCITPDIRDESMKFIVDVMLGRLATWLRLLGHDVLYDRDMDDRQLIRRAQEQERTIITRDTGIARRKVARACIFITSDRVIDQLAEMRQLIGQTEKPRGRCTRCNSELEYIDKSEDVRESVPDYIYHTHERFLRCSACAKMYWEGSHYLHMKEILQQVFR